MAIPLIEVRALSKVYPDGERDITVLDNLSLRIERGEMVAIIGQSGSGKSTLMNILGCLDRASSGEYLLNGRNIAELNADERAILRRDYIGFIFQRYHLIGNLRAQENVEMPAVYAGMGAIGRSKKARALLERLGLGARYQHRPNQLSGGQQQRVSIARALINSGDILLADEPTGALDSQSGKEVMKILRELHAEGQTVIIVTHDAQIAAQADRVIEIKDGKIISDKVITAPNHRLEDDAPIAPTGKVSKALALMRFGYAQRLVSAFRIAIRSLLSHKLRATLTMLGIIIGIASVVTMVALGQGAQQSVLAEISELGSNTLEVYSGNYKNPKTLETQSLTTDDAAILAEQPYIDSVTPEVSFNIQLNHHQHQNAKITGIDRAYLQVQNYTLKAGRAFLAHEISQTQSLALIDENTAQKLYPRQNPIGQMIYIANTPVEIIGVVDTKKRNQRNQNQLQIWLPYTTVMYRLTGQTRLSTLTLKIKPNTDSKVAEAAIKRLLYLRHGQEDFSVFNSDALRDAIAKTTQTLTLLISAIAIISLIVGGIGVMNIMLVSVTERTQEIGIRMAVGARQSDILQQFLIEAILLCLAGGAIGVLLSMGIGAIIHLFSGDFRLIYSSGSIIAAFTCSTVIGLIFGYLPARNAARLDPVQALSKD